MNLSKHSEYKELISLTYVKGITMNLSKHNEYKELISLC
jgi:hypothetical protein